MSENMNWFNYGKDIELIKKHIMINQTGLIINSVIYTSHFTTGVPQIPNSTGYLRHRFVANYTGNIKLSMYLAFAVNEASNRTCQYIFIEKVVGLADNMIIAATNFTMPLGNANILRKLDFTLPIVTGRVYEFIITGAAAGQTIIFQGFISGVV